MAAYFPFQGEQISLKAFEPEDIPSLHTYLNHPELAGRRYIPWGFQGEFPLSRKQVESVYDKWSEEKKGVHLCTPFDGPFRLL